MKKPGAKKVKKAGFEKELTDTSKRALKGSKSTKQDKTSKKDDRIAVCPPLTFLFGCLCFCMQTMTKDFAVSKKRKRHTPRASVAMSEHTCI